MISFSKYHLSKIEIEYKTGNFALKLRGKKRMKERKKIEFPNENPILWQNSNFSIELNPCIIKRKQKKRKRKIREKKSLKKKREKRKLHVTRTKITEKNIPLAGLRIKNAVGFLVSSHSKIYQLSLSKTSVFGCVA